MPPPLRSLAMIARLSDDQLRRNLAVNGKRPTVQFALYDLLRHEQAVAASPQPQRTELSRILDHAQVAFGELVGVLVGRDDALLDTTRDGEWTLRDVLRHAIAVELRYGAQVEYAGTRSDDEPLGIPDDRLPCDRLSPPEPAFADSRTGGIDLMLALLGDARRITDQRLASIGDHALERPSLWGKLEMNVRMRAHQIAVHISEVVIQTEKCLGGALDSEARRILRRCCAARGSHERWSDEDQRARIDATYDGIADPRALS